MENEKNQPATLDLHHTRHAQLWAEALAYLAMRRAALKEARRG